MTSVALGTLASALRSTEGARQQRAVMLGNSVLAASRKLDFARFIEALLGERLASLEAIVAERGTEVAGLCGSRSCFSPLCRARLGIMQRTPASGVNGISYLQIHKVPFIPLGEL
jgi:hypothetical protein